MFFLWPNLTMAITNPIKACLPEAIVRNQEETEI